MVQLLLAGAKVWQSAQTLPCCMACLGLRQRQSQLMQMLQLCAA
jgi:hypothetical protein